MKDILLVNPKFNISKDNYDSSISVGLLCLGSYLAAKGCSVKIIDGARQKNYDEILLQSTKDVKIIGFSVMTTQVAEALIDAEKIRKINSDAIIVFGGLHPTLFSEETAAHKLVDIAVHGEGEKTLFEIFNVLQNSQSKDEFKNKLSYIL